ncbi:MAG: hypothetical protein LBE86_01675 [Gemmobacter sp.]|jgi:hypothetical protein|nr:hypothetical protein [Gemmobacter sp.]
MEMVADILLVAGAFGLAAYCYVLSCRLRKFSRLESGMGGAIAVLSAQVDDMTKVLEKARAASAGSATKLEALTGRAEQTAARLEVILATMHDLPEARPVPEPGQAGKQLRFVRRRPIRDRMEAAE